MYPTLRCHPCEKQPGNLWFDYYAHTDVWTTGREKNIYIYISFSYIHIARGYDEVKHSQELTAKESEGRAQRNSSYYACDFFANLRLFPSYKLEKRASQPDTPTRVQISALPLKSILAHIT